jgi:transcriptional regulator with XRE-family HTH domain
LFRELRHDVVLRLAQTECGNEQRLVDKQKVHETDSRPVIATRVERGEFKPPTEEKVRAIAKALGQDADELLALAGRVASDLTDIIQRRPREMASFLRAANGLSAEDMQRLAEEARRRRTREEA